MLAEMCASKCAWSGSCKRDFCAFLAFVVSGTAGALLSTGWAQGSGQLTPTAGIVAFCVLCIA